MKNIFKFGAALSLAALMVGCGSDSQLSQQVSEELINQEATGVVGGQRVFFDDPVAKHTVLININKGLCTGTLIGKDLVLTAAHCINPIATDMEVIFVRDISQVRDDLRRRVVKAVVHYDYNNSKGKNMADIAVIRFAGSLPFGYEPAPFYSSSNLIKKGQNLRAAGFGVNRAWIVKDGAGILRQIDLKVQNERFSDTEFSFDQGTKKGICSGDSGGPAFATVNGKLHVVGVTSRGDSLPIPLTPDCFILSIFTRVDAYYDWLQIAIKEVYL